MKFCLHCGMLLWYYSDKWSELFQHLKKLLHTHCASVISHTCPGKKHVCNQRWTYSEDEVIFLASLLENQLCGNTGLVKYQLMTCESCISIVLMWNFFPFFFFFFCSQDLQKYSYVNYFCVSLESCSVVASLFSVWLILQLPHQQQNFYYNSQLTTALKAYLSTAERLSTCCLERQRVLGNLLLCRKQLEKMPIIVVGKTFFKKMHSIKELYMYMFYMFLKPLGLPLNS